MVSGELQVPVDSGRSRRSIRARWRASIPTLGIGIALFGCGSQDEPAPDARKPPGVVEERVAEPLETGTRPAPEVRKPPPELGIEDLVIGDGPACDRPGDIVTIHYRGSLLDGRVFDSSYERGKPIVAPLNSLIPGWQLGVPGMRVGGRRRLTVPAHLAYSGMAALSAISSSVTTGSGEILIPPESTLVFEIELLALGDRTSEDVAEISQRPSE